MITWTDAAKEALENYCRRSRENLRGSGADADEVADDLRRHVEEEVRAARLTVATEEEVRRILARVGEPSVTDENPRSGSATSSRAGDKDEQPARPGKFFLAVAFIFGVVLPLGTLLFELSTGASAGVLFDPIPTWFQILAVALIPAVNLWIGRVAITGRCRFPKLAGWLSGMAAGVACFYAILYLPFIPVAGVCLIFFGLGLIPLSPYFAWLYMVLLRRAAGKSLGSPLAGFGRGFGVALAALVLLQVPTAFTYYGLAAATSEDLATQRRGITTLRRFADRDVLLRHCYSGMRGEKGFDLVRLVAGGDRYCAAQLCCTYCRRLYLGKLPLLYLQKQLRLSVRDFSSNGRNLD